MDANGKKFTATLKPEQLVTASVQLGNVEMETTAIGLISSDPFMHCYVCAMSSKGTLEKHGHCGELEIKGSNAMAFSAWSTISASLSSVGSLLLRFNFFFQVWWSHLSSSVCAPMP